jgi:o-succinylbenzoate synthase
VLKFFYATYEINPVTDPEPRRGALLKVQWNDQKIGFADIHPWPELGDEPIEKHIRGLAEGKISTLVEQSIWLAKKDAVYRMEKENAFTSATKVKNHYLVPDLLSFTDRNMADLRTAGFSTLKIKVPAPTEDYAKLIIRMIRQNPIMVRLDFNARLNFEQFNTFIGHFSKPDKAKIEFVEDPFPWSMDSWTEGAKLVPLAMDNEFYRVDWDKLKKAPFKVLVIKPARMDVEKAEKIVSKYNLSAVVTSSLDHPVGVMHACLVASNLKKFYPNAVIECGCLSLKAYKPNNFSIRVETDGPFLRGSPGTGIGFNDLLEKQNWEPVKA